MINALVLAAGESRRMGKSKPLLRFPGGSPRRGAPLRVRRARPAQASGDARPTRCGATTFLEQIISVLRASDVDRTTVVLGAQAAEIRAALDPSGVEVVVNKDYRQGQLSSLVAGLRSVPPDTEAIVLCLVDNPFITAETVNRVIRAFRETRSPIVIPVFDRRRGHPALFARTVFDELRDAPPEEGARYVVHANRDRVLEIDVPDSTILIRIDTPEDYRLQFGVAP